MSRLLFFKSCIEKCSIFVPMVTGVESDVYIFRLQFPMGKLLDFQ